VIEPFEFASTIQGTVKADTSIVIEKRMLLHLDIAEADDCYAIVEDWLDHGFDIGP
jgi:hypothetical protein